MPTYTVNAINIGGFSLGETDRVVSLFTREKGFVKAVAKGARKPGSKIAGRAEALNVNKLLLATGKTFEVISQAETIETFRALRTDLRKLSFGMYYAELTNAFAIGLEDVCSEHFDYLVESLRTLAETKSDPASLCLGFEFNILTRLGFQPELTHCVLCRQPLSDANIEVFNHELGGIVCDKCTAAEKRERVAEGSSAFMKTGFAPSEAVHITPLVWKRLVIAETFVPESDPSPSLARAQDAARRIIKAYIEYRAGKRLKALDLLESI